MFNAFQNDYRANPGSYDNWLYNYSRVTDQPADLGYWIGAEVCRDYFLRAVDKTQALRDIIQMRDPLNIVLKSGYAWLTHPAEMDNPDRSVERKSR